jgi:hypothetical protein
VEPTSAAVLIACGTVEGLSNPVKPVPCVVVVVLLFLGDDFLQDGIRKNKVAARMNNLQLDDFFMTLLFSSVR